jgi:hypothetical protein
LLIKRLLYEENFTINGARKHDPEIEKRGGRRARPGQKISSRRSKKGCGRSGNSSVEGFWSVGDDATKEGRLEWNVSNRLPSFVSIPLRPQDRSGWCCTRREQVG